MKTKVIVVFMFMLIGHVFAQKNTQSILRSYIKLKDAFVKSDSGQISNTAIEFTKVIETESDFTDKKSLLEAVEKITRTKDIEKQREAFSVLSKIFWTIIKVADHIKETIYYQYCPMKKAYWLSTDSVIKNPYYGSKMLSCGSVSERKN
ncbi:DUF3347 domain-containing protein [Sabulilitoribacter multivorans]|uniref:DUF3347 domain-containing protein n=1 Tax=Flaviramulus multivorans TaxID=1304750 RepID=A0ABS9IF69_9FLAO|nr:DUF3347 domain-containing protein [Flaviramulus multivorans]MCF7559025.1 DUF3347 domain-containing protein [Flaviramulus multivorans]